MLAMKNHGSAESVVVVGLGKTGLSCVRFLVARGVDVAVTDSRAHPPESDALRAEYPHVPQYLGGIDSNVLLGASQCVVSPGVDLNAPAMKAIRAAGVECIGDVELFVRALREHAVGSSPVPIVAITGSNAKSTVTDLVGAMARSVGKQVVVCGNIGVPVLDKLDEARCADLVVMELSSFQLESTYSLAASVATVLNISADHMDRYASFKAYQQAKHRIFANAQCVVVNRQEPGSVPMSDSPSRTISVGVDEPLPGQYGVCQQGGTAILSCGPHALMAASELKLVGRHNVVNVLAALALCEAVGISNESVLPVLREYTGLPHRCQHVGNWRGVDWFNDSKGTNVGAAIAAINGIGESVAGKILLIAGGEGKGADFRPLQKPIDCYVSALILIGRDAKTLAGQLRAGEVLFAEDMAHAVALAGHAAKPGDAVLLSPACASFDRYASFEHRGDDFMQIVKTSQSSRDPA